MKIETYWENLAKKAEIEIAVSSHRVLQTASKLPEARKRQARIPPEQVWREYGPSST
jgi:hypothetical protein